MNTDINMDKDFGLPQYIIQLDGLVLQMTRQGVNLVIKDNYLFALD